MSAVAGAASVSEVSSSVPRLTAIDLSARSSLPVDLEVGRADDGDVVGRVGGGEVDDLLALLRVADAHQEVDALFGEVGNAVLAGHGDRVELHLERVGDELRDVHVVALEAHVGAGRGEGREIGEDADIDLAGRGDVVDGVGGGLGGKAEGGSERQAARRRMSGSTSVFFIVIPLFVVYLFVMRIRRRRTAGGGMHVFVRSSFPSRTG